MGLTKKKVSPVALLCEIAIMAAAGFVLDELASAYSRGLFVNGGAIGIAMITVVVMAYRRGPLAGLATAFIIGFFDLMTGPYMVAASPFLVFVQVALDYVLPYPAIALCGVFKPAFDKAETKKEKLFFLSLGVMVGTLGKLFCHYSAGVLFWADPNGFAWGMTNINPYLYCFLYNGAFCFPSGILSGLVLALTLQKAPQLFLLSKLEDKPLPRRAFQKWETITVISAGIGGLALFGYFLYRFIASFYYGDYGADGSEFSFDGDMMVAWIASLLLALFSLIALLRARKERYIDGLYPKYLVFLGGLVSVYGLARLMRALIKGKDALPYLFWIIGGLIFAGIVIAFLIIKRKRKQNEAEPK